MGGDLGPWSWPGKVAVLIWIKIDLLPASTSKAPQLSARHRGRTRVSTDYSQPPWPPFFTILHLFLKLDMSWFEIVLSVVRSQIFGGRRPISEKMGKDGGKSWLKSVETLVRPLWLAAGSGKPLRLPRAQLQKSTSSWTAIVRFLESWAIVSRCNFFKSVFEKNA